MWENQRRRIQRRRRRGILVVDRGRKFGGVGLGFGFDFGEVREERRCHLVLVLVHVLVPHRYRSLPPNLVLQLENHSDQRKAVSN